MTDATETAPKTAHTAEEEQQKAWKEFCKNEPYCAPRLFGPAVENQILARVVPTILEGVNFAAEKHKRQRRKDAEATPYINHPIGVSHILTQVGVHDVDTINAGLFHDLIEDVGVTRQEIEEKFGAKVASIVMEVTDDKTLPKADRKKLQIEHAAHASKEAQLVKLADKIYNVRDLLANPIASWPPSRIQGYVAWSKLVVDAIINNSTEHNPGFARDRAFDELERLFNEACTGKFTVTLENGQTVTLPALPPPSADIHSFVEAYYASLG